ncbi:hypothetical protein VIGAN_04179800, partial [Vigna angularis var. angularis]
FENIPRISFLLLCLLVSPFSLPVHTYTQTICVSLPLPFFFVCPATQRHTAPRSSVSLGFPLPLSILAHRGRRTAATRRHMAHINKSSSC